MITHEQARKAINNLSHAVQIGCEAEIELLQRYIDQQQSTLRAQDIKTSEGYFRSKR